MHVIERTGNLPLTFDIELSVVKMCSYEPELSSFLFIYFIFFFE